MTVGEPKLLSMMTLRPFGSERHAHCVGESRLTPGENLPARFLIELDFFGHDSLAPLLQDDREDVVLAHDQVLCAVNVDLPSPSIC